MFRQNQIYLLFEEILTRMNYRKVYVLAKIKIFIENFDPSLYHLIIYHLITLLGRVYNINM